MFYVIFNNSLLISKNKNILEKYYGNVSNLPEDYETNKYIVSNNELVLNPNFEIEKQNAPGEIKRQADSVRGKAGLRGLDVLFAVRPNYGRADAHQNVKQRPDDGKQNRGRRERRCSHLAVNLHVTSGQKRRQPTDQKRNGNGDGENFQIARSISSHPILSPF